MPYVAPILADPDLGLSRFCAGCDEWWPLDDEFWYYEPRRPGALHCRACMAAAGRAYEQRHPEHNHHQAVAP